MRCLRKKLPFRKKSILVNDQSMLVNGNQRLVCEVCKRAKREITISNVFGYCLFVENRNLITKNTIAK